MSNTTAMAPVSASERIDVIDILRTKTGLAVGNTLALWVWFTK